MAKEANLAQCPQKRNLLQNHQVAILVTDVALFSYYNIFDGASVELNMRLLGGMHQSVE